MKLLFSWTGVTSYMADCWRLLQSEPGIELKIIVETADSGKTFAVDATLRELNYEVVAREESETCEIVTFSSDFIPDVVFVGGWRSRTTRRVMAYYQYVPQIFCLDMPWRWSWRCVIARFALRGFVRRFQAVYVPGRTTAFYARWLGFPKNRIYRKLYAIDQRRFREGSTGVVDSRTGFLFMGRHSPEKRIDVIERAYRRYRELGGSWTIDYYGQGGTFVQADGIPKIYREHACLVLASSFDPWPLVMLEARASGLEVIASDRCGNCDELGAHKVPYGDAEAMAQKMLEVECGAKAPRCADLDSYDCRAWVPRTLRIVREVMDSVSCEANGMVVVDQLLRKHGIIREDEVWVHGMWTPGKWGKCIGAWIKGKKLVRMTHGSLSPIYLEKQGKWKKRLVAPIERLCFWLADRVVVTCKSEKEWCQQWRVKGKIEVVDLKRFFDLDKPRTKSRVEQRNLHILYLGRRHPLKGVEFLERAVEELNQSFEHSEHSNIRAFELRIVSDHFGDELEKDWSWCDVLVLPTLSENFGLVVAEALERGKKVITTDGAPAWAYLKPERGIYLKGYRDGTDIERVRMLKEAIVEMTK